MSNLNSILDNGIRPGIDGCVYLADTEENALRFMMFRPETRFAVFRIDPPKGVKESFDHDIGFWGCRAWLYRSTIRPTRIKDVKIYSREE